MSKVITVKNPQDFHQLDAPAKALASGELVAFPTETVYGLGANALDADAVKSIFTAKGRPQDNPLIVHIAQKSQIYDLVKSVPPAAEKILDTLTPGPVTIILEKNDTIPDVVTAGGKTVALRIPANDIAQELIARAGVPVAAPSANTSGKPSPTKAEHVKEDLWDKVSYIIDGGSCSVGLESTVVDLTVSPPAILRPGGISHEELVELIGEVRGYKSGDSDTAAPKSPGMKYRHYAPKAKMTVFKGQAFEEAIKEAIDANPQVNVCVLTAGERTYQGADTINCGATPEEYSKNLFDALRTADNQGADIIFAELPFPSGGIATALYNRIYKSCGGNVVLCK